MSRVEDAREEQRIEDAKQLAKRLEQAQQAKTRHLFRNMVEKQQTQTHTKQQQHQAQQQQARGQANLLSRRGIQHNKATEQLLHESEHHLEQARSQRQQDLQGQTSKRAKVSQSPGQEPQAPHASSGAKQSQKDRNKDQQGQSEGRIQDKQAGAERLLQQASFHLPVQQVGPGQSKAQGAGAAASSINPATQAILDAIVDKIHKGITANGLGLMEISLKDNVLHGAKLRILAGQSGVQLGIFCENKADARLLGAGETCRELADKMAQKGLVLQRLEINSQRIMG